MSKKKTEQTLPVPKQKNNPNTLREKAEPHESYEYAFARKLLSPSSNAALRIKGIYGECDAADITALGQNLSDSVKLTINGDMTTVESMLLSQAYSLDALFTEYTRRAIANKNNEHWFKPYMNMALRSQSQCRATLEALIEMKNPRPYIQNNRADYQQVNNGPAPSRAMNDITPHAQAGENSKSTNELLEDKQNEQEWLDTGAPQTAGGNDQELEAVGAIQRPQNRRGKSRIKK